MQSKGNPRQAGKEIKIELFSYTNWRDLLFLFQVSLLLYYSAYISFITLIITDK